MKKLIIILATALLSFNCVSAKTISVSLDGSKTLSQAILSQTESLMDVTTLNVSGTLTNADYETLLMLSALDTLDLRNTGITTIRGFQGLNISTVMLPESARTIGRNAFESCKKLKNINLSRIEHVRYRAFYECEQLQSVDLNNCVVVDTLAFSKCSSLETIDMPKVRRVVEGAFCPEDDIDKTKLRSVNMPVVTFIGQKAFRKCLYLEQINMPLVDSIGHEAFHKCYSLTNIDISNATYIENDAFKIDDDYNMTSKLTTVRLCDQLQVIPSGCFDGCKQLKDVNLPSGLKRIEDGAFFNCPIDTLDLPEGVTYIGHNITNKAKVIYIPSSTLSLGSLQRNDILKTVYCRIVTPIELINEWFELFNEQVIQNAVLYVPAISVEAYKLSPTWYKFGHILPLYYTLNSLNIVSDFTLSDFSTLSSNPDLSISANGHLTINSKQSLSVGKFAASVVFDDWQHTPGWPTLLHASAISANELSINVTPRPGRWAFISFPFDVDLSSIEYTANIPWVIREYSGANRASGNGDTWMNVANNGVLQAGQGYIIFDETYYDNNNNSIIGDFCFKAIDNAKKNNIFSQQDITIPLSHYPASRPHNANWNLIGNPFLAYISISELDYTAPITIWDGEKYKVYSPLDDTYYMHPLEAFFVQAPDDVNQITFNADACRHSAASEVQPVIGSAHVASSSTIGNKREVFNITLSYNEHSDHTRVVFNSEARADYELERDAAKMFAAASSVAEIYIIDNGVQYAIDERPETKSVDLGMCLPEDGQYTISMQRKRTDRKVMLTDNETNTTVDITKEQYTFSARKGTNNKRFTLRFAPAVVSALEDNAVNNAKARKILKGGHVVIQMPNGKTYSIGGQEL